MTNYNLSEDQDKDAIEMKAIAGGITHHKLTRHILKQRDDWTTSEQSEWKQLSLYQKQNTFGDPIPRPPPKKDKEGKLKPLTILPAMWTYLFKDSNIPKASDTCNDGKRQNYHHGTHIRKLC